MATFGMYRDSTSYVSSGNDSLGFTTLGNYQLAGTSNVPQSSLLLLSVAPSNIKYFDPSPTFQQRLDNYRLAPTTQVAVNLTTDYNDYPGGADSWTPPAASAASSTPRAHDDVLYPPLFVRTDGHAGVQAGARPSLKV